MPKTHNEFLRFSDKRINVPVIFISFLCLVLPAGLTPVCMAQEYGDAPKEINMQALEPYHRVLDTIEITSTGKTGEILYLELHQYSYEHTRDNDYYDNKVQYFQILNSKNRPEIDSINVLIRRSFLYGTYTFSNLWTYVWYDSVTLAQTNKLPTGSLDKGDSQSAHLGEEEANENEWDKLYIYNFTSTNTLSLSHGVLSLQLKNTYRGGNMYRVSRANHVAYLCFDINSGQQLTHKLLLKPSGIEAVDKLIRNQLSFLDEGWQVGLLDEQTAEVIPLQHFFLSEDVLVVSLNGDPWDPLQSLAPNFNVFDAWFHYGPIIIPLDRIRQHLNTEALPALKSIQDYKFRHRTQLDSADRYDRQQKQQFPFALLSKWPLLCANAYAIDSYEKLQWEMACAGQNVRRIQVNGPSENENINLYYSRSGTIDSIRYCWLKKNEFPVQNTVRIQETNSDRFQSDSLRIQNKHIYYDFTFQTVHIEIDNYRDGWRLNHGAYFEFDDYQDSWRNEHLEQNTNFEYRWLDNSGSKTLKFRQDGKTGEIYDWKQTPSKVSLLEKWTELPADPALNYVYDDKGRLLEVTHTCDDEVKLTTFQYDDDGLLQSVNNEIKVLYEYW